MLPISRQQERYRVHSAAHVIIDLCFLRCANCCFLFIISVLKGSLAASICRSSGSQLQNNISLLFTGTVLQLQAETNRQTSLEYKFLQCNLVAISQDEELCLRTFQRYEFTCDGQTLAMEQGRVECVIFILSRRTRQICVELWVVARNIVCVCCHPSWSD